MKKRFLYSFILLLVVFFSLNTEVMFAETISNVNEKIRKLEKEQSEIKQKTNKITEEKTEIGKQKDANKAEQSSVQEKLDKIEAELATTNANIQSVTAKIKTTENEIHDLTREIDQLQKEIKELERRIEERNQLLKDRLRSIQESGGKAKYISVLLGAQNFTDFIMRTTAVNTIMDQDRNIMEEHEQDQRALEQKKKEVELKKAEVEMKKTELEGQRSKLEGLKVQLDEQKAEQSKLKKQLEKEYQEMEEYELSLEEKQEIFAAEARAIEELKLQAEKEKAAIEAEEARQRRIAMEAKKRAESNTVSKQSSNPQPSGGSSVNQSTSPPSGNGLLLKPVSAYPINSPYRSAHRPNHKGIDIAAPEGTAVHAAASGKVTRVVTGCRVGNHGCGGGFGNVVYITHYLNGRTITTVYAHLSSVNVSTGQSVSRGQVIGGVGNTGHSFGNHLHFEVHEGGFNGNASARNPESYF